jgi:Xaa-Pro aminopeptidase
VAGNGHEPGTGPLPAGLSIQIDIWPRHEASACWADMARTFMVDDPAPEHTDLIAEQARLVRSALTQAQTAVRPGITEHELFDAACDSFESAGHPTQRTAQSDEGLDGFRHSLGHGVGLEVYDAPPLGLAEHDPLVLGDGLAIEPGLWDSRFGGGTFEDLVLVTENGCEVLLGFPTASHRPDELRHAGRTRELRPWPVQVHPRWSEIGGLRSAQVMRLSTKVEAPVA